MNREDFKRLTEQKIVLLDGATGSNYRTHGMPPGVCTEVWALEHPEIAAALIDGYVRAGSDIVYAPTFSANRLSLAMHGLQDRVNELNTELVALAKRAAAGRAFVAGDITTTGRVLEPQGDATYSELLDAYAEQVRAQVRAGADLIVAETMLNIEEATAAVEAARSVCDLPVMCTFTVEADGSLLYGGTIVDAIEALQALGADAVGLNCSVGPDQLEAVVSSMCAAAEVPIIVKPNAGIPVMDEHGIAHFSMTADAFARAMRRLIDCGARIIGGCCGTTPDYLRALGGQCPQPFAAAFD